MSIAAIYTQFRSKSILSKSTRFLKGVNNLTAWAEGVADCDIAQEFHKLKDQKDLVMEKVFALSRQAAFKTLGLRPFDEQIIGGFVLASGCLAEMKTGEGKTLTIVAAAAYRALQGKGVHVVTANSYLAKRDALLMAPVYEKLGLTVSFVEDNQSLEDKKKAYLCDITYGVGSEFGFDFLKDNLAKSAADTVQRGNFSAIVDEVDSVLIDEARVPLIIAQQTTADNSIVATIDKCVKELVPGEHFYVDLKEQTADLTEQGYAFIEKSLVAMGALETEQDLYANSRLNWVTKIHAAVKVYALYRKDKEYVVKNNEISLVDAGSGRVLDGRRLESGLHEALEAREGLNVKAGTEVRAKITFQGYFGKYQHLAGLSGTAATDADEFAEIYGLETVKVPTHRPLIRQTRDDLVFLNKIDKLKALVEEVKERHAKGQPILVGCAAIRTAEVVSALLSKEGLTHEVLTAKHIAREASIIAKAGELGAITVATNMAGRGTDIGLGGEKPEKSHFANSDEFNQALARWNESVLKVNEAGGLCVLGTERSGIRRVDNQLAGRSGRQGDPGFVQFYLSLEDELLGVFGKNKQLSIVRKMISESGQAVTGHLVSRLVASAQDLVGHQGFTARKSLLQYDKAYSDQRDAVYAFRNAVLQGEAQSQVKGWSHTALVGWVGTNLPVNQSVAQWPLAKLKSQLLADLGLEAPFVRWAVTEELSEDEISDAVITLGEEAIQKNIPEEPDARSIMLGAIDFAWTKHLTDIEELQKNASLKGNTGLNPLFQFGKDAFALFKSFEERVSYAVCLAVLDSTEKEKEAAAKTERQLTQSDLAKVEAEQLKRWVNRNEACPCNSGKRFKDCHGKI